MDFGFLKIAFSDNKPNFLITFYIKNDFLTIILDA